MSSAPSGFAFTNVAGRRRNALSLAAIYLGADVNDLIAVSSRKPRRADAGVSRSRGDVIASCAVCAFVFITSGPDLAVESAKVRRTLAKVIDGVSGWQNGITLSAVQARIRIAGVNQRFAPFPGVTRSTATPKIGS